MKKGNRQSHDTVSSSIANYSGRVGRKYGGWTRLRMMKVDRRGEAASILSIPYSLHSVYRHTVGIAHIYSGQSHSSSLSSSATFTYICVNSIVIIVFTLRKCVLVLFFSEK